jgi:hypothetical protein
MSIDPAPISLDTALSCLPKILRNRLIKNYTALKSNALENRHDSIGHQAGKLAEVLIRIVQHTLTSTFVPLSADLPNFKTECEKIERLPKTSGPEGLRVLMPRALLFLYMDLPPFHRTP